jgi:MoxR-like ATPase
VARAWALVNGRAFVVPSDIEQLFVPVVAHRLVFEAFALAEEEMGEQSSLIESVTAECLRLAPPPELSLESAASHVPASLPG